MSGFCNSVHEPSDSTVPDRYEMVHTDFIRVQNIHFPQFLQQFVFHNNSCSMSNPFLHSKGIPAGDKRYHITSVQQCTFCEIKLRKLCQNTLIGIR
jgi:hypothetical protein